MELPGRAAHAIRSCLCMFRRGRTFSQQKQKKLKFDQKGSHFGLVVGPQLPQKCYKLHLGALGCKMEGQGAFWGAKWRERLRLGCKMEGPGAVWGPKWRVRERSESTVAGTALAHWIIWCTILYYIMLYSTIYYRVLYYTI